LDVPVLDSKTTAADRHNGNSLDVIMPVPRRGSVEWVNEEKKVISSIGADGGRAYTVTFTDHNLKMYKDQYLYDMVEMIMKKTKGVVKYKMIGEYSETGRYHLHGVVLCNTLQQHGNLQRKLRRTFGIVKVKVIDNTPKWAEYCVKSYAKQEAIAAHKI